MNDTVGNMKRNCPIKKEIDDLPSEEQEYKWTLWNGQKISERGYGLCEEDRIRCPECGYITNPLIAKWACDDYTIGQIVLPNRCPKCLADMRGEQNAEV